MSESNWAPDAIQEPHEKPTIPEYVGTDIAPDGEKIVVNRAQDVEPILDHCKALVASNTYRTPSGDMHHAADFPMVLVEAYMASKGITFDQFLEDSSHVKNMLADPALRDFCIARNITHRVYR